MILYLELVLFLFVALPFVFKYTPYIQRNMVFLPFVRWPGVVDFNDPEGSCDLKLTRNLYLQSEDGVSVGVWHILPSSYIQTHNQPDHEELLQSDNKTVVLYLHLGEPRSTRDLAHAAEVAHRPVLIKHFFFSFFSLY